ncbi:MAG: cation:proton antiporter [Oceanipulchritudo sp.]
MKPVPLIASAGETEPGLILLFGLLAILSLLMKVLLERASLPPILGYLLIGIALAWFNGHVDLLDDSGELVLGFLASLGVVVLLFRVGIESNLHALLEQLPRAAVVWLPNMIVSGVPGYLVTRHLLDYGLVPSLFVGVALTATSIGVSVAVWEEQGRLKSRDGGLLLDTAELDDISGVALMALLFSVAPHLHLPGPEGDPGSALPGALFATGGTFLLKFLVFVVLLTILGKYLEGPLASVARRVGDKPAVLVLAFGLGVLIAGAAGLAGLSLPIGALFAGLLLSRHRNDYGVEPFYLSIHLLLVPFFFIQIGYHIAPEVVGTAAGVGAVLALVAILGKVIGTGLTARLFTSWKGVLLIGASMVPRAEITMVVIERGRQLGDWAMPEDLYAGMVMVSAVTCLGTVLFLHWALRRFGGG